MVSCYLFRMYLKQIALSNILCTTVNNISVGTLKFARRKDWMCCKLKNFENSIKEYRHLYLERDIVVGEKWFPFKNIYRRLRGDR